MKISKINIKLEDGTRLKVEEGDLLCRGCYFFDQGGRDSCNGGMLHNICGDSHIFVERKPKKVIDKGV